MKFYLKRKKNKGVAAIEFAIGFIFFWYMIAAWVEMSFMSYVSAVGDLAISRASEVAKKYQGSEVDGFVTAFNNELQKENSVWNYLTDLKGFSISVSYLNNFDELVKYDGDCEKDEDGKTECADSSTNAAIAIYSISYRYKPIFNYFVDSKNIFTREMIVIQEYQREQFSIPSASS